MRLTSFETQVAQHCVVRTRNITQHKLKSAQAEIQFTPWKTTPETSTCGGVFVRIVCLDEDHRNLPRMVCKRGWKYIVAIRQQHPSSVQLSFRPKELLGVDFHIRSHFFIYIHPPFLCLLCVSSVAENLRNAKKTFAERT